MRQNRARDEAGAIAILVALLAVGLLVVAGIIVDLGLARDTRQRSQVAADASALAAANVLYPVSDCVSANASGSKAPPCLDDAIDVATEYAETNYDVAPGDWVHACPAPPEGFSPLDASRRCVSFDSLVKPTRVWVVMPTRAISTGFGALAGVDVINVSAAAQASVSDGGIGDCGFCVLDKGSVSGNPELSLTNTSLHFNNGPSFSGNPTIEVLNGLLTTEKPAQISGKPTLQPAPSLAGHVADPLAGLPLPFVTAGLPLRGDKNGDVSVSGQGSCQLLPGRYRNISISGGVECALSPGLYAITGTVSMSGHSGVDATSGVTLYFTCGTAALPRECGAPPSSLEPGGSMKVSGTNDFAIKAPGTGPSKGLAVVYDRRNSASLDYSGTNQDILIGTIYAASATLNLSGTADSANTDSMIVVKNLNLSGNGTLDITYTAANNVELPPSEVALSR